MKRWKGLVAGRRPRSSRSSLRLESLERRLPLAGDVVAEVVGSTLRLTGDSLGNEVMVASAAGGRIAVIGQGTTINGSPSAFTTSKAVTSIVASLSGGDDAVGFGNSAAEYAFQRQFTILATSPFGWSEELQPPAPFDVAALQAAIDEVARGVTTFSIPGSLTVTTGGGNDSVGVAGNVGGRVVVRLGSAELGNGLVVGSERTPSRIGGGVIVTGGDGNDLVAIGNVSVAGTVSAVLGDGMNWMVVGGEADTPTNVDAISYTGGMSIDLVGLAGDVTVRKDVRVFTGSQGEDSVSFSTSDGGGTVSVLGDVVVNTGAGDDGDTVSVVGDIRGSLSVTTGSGRDTVSVSAAVGWISSDGADPVPSIEATGPSTIGRDLRITTGVGSDVVAVGPATIGRNATIDAGSGDDDVRLDAVQVRRNLFVRLGAGDDSLGIANLQASAAFLFGGGGTNALSMDAATPAATTKLRTHQFRGR